jgi:hypothetical protein
MNNNDQFDDLDAELFGGAFGAAFALSLLAASVAVLWLF